jgi:hypothetical protein
MLLGCGLMEIRHPRFFGESRMSATESSQIDVEMLRRVAQNLSDAGVVGNDGDIRLDTPIGPTSLAELQVRLNDAGYAGGSLAIETLVRPREDVDVLIYDRDRFANSADVELAWERDYRRRWHDLTEKSADDWIERLKQLRSSMATWLGTLGPTALTINDRPPVTMSEEPMRRFGVGPKQMPAFEILDGNRPIMRVLPRALWTIGANGRVDLITKAAAPILVDQSERLSRPSRWEIYSPRDKGRLVPLTEERFHNLIRAGQS